MPRRSRSITVGKVCFSFDPGNPYNARIVDLALAPRNADSRVAA